MKTAEDPNGGGEVVEVTEEEIHETNQIDESSTEPGIEDVSPEPEISQDVVEDPDKETAAKSQDEGGQSEAERQSKFSDSKSDRKQKKIEKEADDESSEDFDDDYEHPVLKEFSRKLSKSLSKIGARVYNGKGKINWDETAKFFNNLQADMVSKLSSLGVLTQEDLTIFTEKFSDLRKFVSSDIVAENYHASKKTSEKLLKSLIRGVKDLQDAAEEAAEHSSWSPLLKKGFKKIKSGMNNSWKQIKSTFNSIIRKNKDEHHHEGKKYYDDDDSREFSHHEKKREKSSHEKRGKSIAEEEEDWETARGKAREDKRVREQKGEWLFDRSKERDQQRKEERRGDWYNDRKERRRHYDSEEDQEDDHHHQKRAKIEKFDEKLRFREDKYGRERVRG
eukprot:TRINITY_DN5078_c0_g1_i6.p1 TRINITY_DN5078_c0_g1~~TRINITY_DN5078_c0_g1_i6.p1  ORF type:complete len:392 (-),score=119.21 TRINITY_DN5078_c0_g1_i6:298-1473(-)